MIDESKATLQIFDSLDEVERAGLPADVIAAARALGIETDYVEELDI